MIKHVSLLVLMLALVSRAQAEMKLPTILSDHMVLQQKQSDPIWGWDAPGTKVTVTFAGQTKTAVAGSDGKWMVKLDSMPASVTPQVVIITGTSRIEIQDVLVGEVWVCSGQSNMEFRLGKDPNGDLEAAVSDLPAIRLITVPPKGCQELLNDFKGEWKAATPETARNFSAIGFLCGRYIHQMLHVPVGLIENHWGGAAAEAFVPRPAIDRDPRFKRLADSAAKMEAELLPDNGDARFAAGMMAWTNECAKAKSENKPAPQKPRRWLQERSRPGNTFGAMVHPILCYGIKGVFWYQGEANAGRAWEYADLFPFMIEQWRKEWQQGDFPFYWVQLPNYQAEQAQPKESAWAELREAQTRTMKLPNTGQAVIIDLGEGKDIHPKNKHDVAPRLARWALANDYGIKIPYRSPEFKSLTIRSNTATVTFDCFGGTLRAFGVEELRGFAICGADKKWQNAMGRITGTNTVEVWSENVLQPVALRYAWADNPVCNLYADNGLPVTPFRTDDFEWTTKPKPAPIAQTNASPIKASNPQSHPVVGDPH